jgi:phosphoribosylformylglycinamidine synthase I
MPVCLSPGNGELCKRPRAAIIVGYGINCDRELEAAFNEAGAYAWRVHLNELEEELEHELADTHIICLPGGFSFGDDTFAGNIFAKKILYSKLKEGFKKHLDKGGLILGVCNGNQIGTMLNLIPVFNERFDSPETAYTYNNSARYEDRGNIHLKVVSEKSHWLRGLDKLYNIPIGHGEGKFYAPPEIVKKLYEKDLVALKYINENGAPADGKYPINPNGSLDDIAGLASEQVLLMMPHPERAIKTYNQDGWTRRKSILKRAGLPTDGNGGGMRIIQNGVDYARKLL